MASATHETTSAGEGNVAAMGGPHWIGGMSTLLRREYAGLMGRAARPPDRACTSSAPCDVTSHELIVSCVELAGALDRTGFAVTCLPRNSMGAAQVPNFGAHEAAIHAGTVEPSRLTTDVLTRATGPTAVTGPGGTTAGPVAKNTEQRAVFPDSRSTV